MRASVRWIFIWAHAFLFAEPVLAEGSARGCIDVATETEEVCTVSHLRLVADPSSYNGKLIVVSGILGEIDDGYILFHSKEAAEHGSRIDAIFVRDVEADDVKRDPEVGDWVRVFGRFRDSWPDDSLGRSIGQIDEVRLMYKESAYR